MKFVRNQVGSAVFWIGMGVVGLAMGQVGPSTNPPARPSPSSSPPATAPVNEKNPVVPSPSAAQASDPTAEQMGLPIETGLKAKPMYTGSSVRGVEGGVGRVMFAYGHSQPTVPCAPLHVCVVNLMPGEKINDINIGDSVRWLIQSSQAGDRPIILMKPTVSGISTNLVVTTDQNRVYYLNLVSTETKYLPQVGFYDTQEMTVKQRAVEEKEQTRLDGPGIDPARLDFNFTCKADSGGSSLLPKQVFAGNGHTYLAMPEDMKYKDAPAVFNVSSGSTELINGRYDPNKGYFIVDGQPEAIKLVIGNADSTASVTCTHGSKNKSWWSN